ncbi:MAG TPA: nuclear transport factor 2 family protein [Mycobacteriales bacterium]|nr:nuclear transport factor 2 family protein [Mycobacteriales bacterium]
MPGVDEVADKLAIQELIARYPILLDGGAFDRLGELFTPDARIDFSAFGGPVGSPAEIVRFLTDALGVFRRTQHMMGLPAITLDGNRATARTSCNNPMVIDNPDGSTAVWLIGLWYDDDFVRTPDGWRFSGRRQERCYSIVGLPDTALGGDR